MSRVSSMELEGISNACRINVMMNRPVTSTPASEARNSTVVSWGFSSTVCSSSFLLTKTAFSFFGTVAIRFRGFHFASGRAKHPNSHTFLTHQPKSTFPARDLEHVSHRVSEMKKSITHGWRSGKIVAHITRRPINQKWASNDVFSRHESPIAAVLAVIAVITQHEILSLGDN